MNELFTDQATNDFEAFFLELMHEHDNSIREYDLLKRIEDELPEFFAEDGDFSTLYRKHFWLFHQLYQLRERLIAKGLRLNIHTLGIELTPIGTQSSKIGEFDALSEFYLNLDNLELSESEVEAMQKKFWEKYLALEQMSDAIKLLQLTGVEPLTLDIVKSRYRELSQKHHPDKGGDAATFNEIKSAYQSLKKLLN